MMSPEYKYVKIYQIVPFKYVCIFHVNYNSLNLFFKSSWNIALTLIANVGKWEVSKKGSGGKK